MTLTQPPLRLTMPPYEILRHEAIQVLVNGLGLTKTAVFLREAWSSKTDYLELKEQLFGDQTAAEIYADIKSNSHRLN